MARVEWADGSGDALAAGAAGYSAEELVEFGLRAGLLDESLPEQLGALSFMVDVTDPLAPLRELTLPEGSVEPIARLLVVEHLVGSHRASSVDGLELGPPHQGRRAIRLAYMEPRRFSNLEPGRRTIEGSWRAA